MYFSRLKKCVGAIGLSAYVFKFFWSECDGQHHVVASQRTNLRTEWRHMAINPLKAELNPIRHFIALVGARHIVDVNRIRVKQIIIALSVLRRQ